MMMIRQTGFTAVIALVLATVLSWQAHAQDGADSAEQIARNYLDAYSRIDVAEMSSMLADDAVFDDRSSTNTPGGPYYYEGRDAIISAMTLFREEFGLYQIEYDLDFDWEAGGQAVFGGAVEARWHRPDGQDQVWRGDVMTTIRIRGGMVVEHLDMPDYDGGVMTVEPPASP